ncbi:MAG: competence/damage-inducible protein A [Actinobacteria bacterium]|nr:competence/damage-inducible protein A [Actinomycetota bacterium]
MSGYDLLRKTELQIDDIHLSNANLSTIAATAADVLGFERAEVLVVDYRDGTLVLDIHSTSVDAYAIVGQQENLLGSLGALRGVRVTDKTSVSSRGMLGWIALDRDLMTGALERGEKIAADVLRNVANRVIVFSSGTEVENGEIEDTNTPTITEYLTDVGYKVSRGEVLRDNMLSIAAKLREAAEIGGYGIIITTGGVGAEDKDQTVEAVMEVDPDAAMPYICHFEVGTGRHVKDGVRIAVGEYNGTLIISLPGPNDEVKASLEPIVQGLKAGFEKTDLAESIAENLRAILRKKYHSSSASE